jgi:hypothetical protein
MYHIKKLWYYARRGQEGLILFALALIPDFNCSITKIDALDKRLDEIDRECGYASYSIVAFVDIRSSNSAMSETIYALMVSFIFHSLFQGNVAA